MTPGLEVGGTGWDGAWVAVSGAGWPLQRTEAPVQVLSHQAVLRWPLGLFQNPVYVYWGEVITLEPGGPAVLVFRAHVVQDAVTGEVVRLVQVQLHAR
ncbi:MAG: hypothetical protein AB1445_03280 [Bacillota bacterium]